MPANILHQVGRLCCNVVRKAHKATRRSRSPLLVGRTNSFTTGKTQRRRSRWQLWRKRRSIRVEVVHAPLYVKLPGVPARKINAESPLADASSTSDDENAFLDFDGTQAAVGIDISLRQQSEVASVRASTGLPSFIPPMPDRLPTAYELIKTVNGTLGHFNNPIHLVRHRSSGKQFVIKQVPLVSNKQESPLDDPLESLTEASLLQQLKHDNIISLEDVHLDRNGPFCIANIILQYCDGGDVYDFIASIAASKKKVPVQFVQHFVSSMIDAILFLHHGESYSAVTDEIQKHSRQPPILHRDIKERNIFLEKSNPAPNGLPTVILADFGLATTIQNNKGLCGTPGYMAPEDLYGGGADSSDNSSTSTGSRTARMSTGSDWYAFGVTLYQIITGKPYSFQTSYNTQLDLAASSACDEQEILRLVLVCLKTNPNDRPQAKDTLGLHRLSANLKAGLQIWHDGGGRLAEDIWPEAFRFERCEPSGCGRGSEAIAVLGAAGGSLRQAPLEEESIVVAFQEEESIEVAFEEDPSLTESCDEVQVTGRRAAMRMFD